MGAKEVATPSGGAAEEERARRQREQQILDRVRSGSPFAYLLGETYREKNRLTPEQAREQYELAFALVKQIQGGANLPDLDALFDDGRYEFLTEPYGGAGVTGWGALQAFLKQKRFGEN